MGSLFDDIEPPLERSNTLKTPILTTEKADFVKKNKELEQKCQQWEAEMLQITRTNQNRKYKIEEIITLMKLLLEKEAVDEPLNPAIGQIFYSITEYYAQRQKRFNLTEEQTFAMHHDLLKNSKLMYFDVKKVFTEQMPDFAYHYYVLQTTLRF
jgi:hypothetical protein